MKSYDIGLDIKRICAYFDITSERFSEEIGLSRMQILRLSQNEDSPKKETLEKIYSFPFSRGINLNQGKSSLFSDNAKGRKLLFHGTSGDIKGEIDVNHSVPPNDFGNGFYAGETLTQGATWVAGNEYASVYCFYADLKQLKAMKFYPDRNWLYSILYYRGALRDYEIPNEVAELIYEIEQSDIIVAPIADNEVYATIQSFADSEMTDEACIHAISASNLGYQYVFKNNEACKRLLFLDRLYLCKQEKEEYIAKKRTLSKEGLEKSRLAKIEYRRKGRYFDEIFKRKG